MRTTLYFKFEWPKIAWRVLPSLISSLEMLGMQTSNLLDPISLRQYLIVPQNVCTAYLSEPYKPLSPQDPYPCWSTILYTSKLWCQTIMQTCYEPYGPSRNALVLPLSKATMSAMQWSCKSQSSFWMSVLITFAPLNPTVTHMSKTLFVSLTIFAGFGAQMTFLNATMISKHKLCETSHKHTNNQTFWKIHFVAINETDCKMKSVYPQ